MLLECAGRICLVAHVECVITDGGLAYWEPIRGDAKETRGLSFAALCSITSMSFNRSPPLANVYMRNRIRRDWVAWNRSQARKGKEPTIADGWADLSEWRRSKTMTSTLWTYKRGVMSKPPVIDIMQPQFDSLYQLRNMGILLPWLQDSSTCRYV